MFRSGCIGRSEGLAVACQWLGFSVFANLGFAVHRSLNLQEQAPAMGYKLKGDSFSNLRK